jgi:hypothetical protein
MSDPWATPEVGRRTDPRPVAPPGPYVRGVAQVGVPRPRVDDTTPALDQPPPTRRWRGEAGSPVRPQLRQLRIGGHWTTMGALFAFVCWGIWAISSRGDDLTGPSLAFFLVLLVAAGLFTLLRLLGRAVLERSLGRTRRGARGSHLVTGLFLVAAGIAYLGQTAWVVDAWTWLKGMIW